MTVTTIEAVALRAQLERDILALLRQFRDTTGLSPIGVDVCSVRNETIGGGRDVPIISSVRVTVEL